ncbi:MAG TPA: hypothetical protein VFX60_17180 [Micromonospora sp.]|nr:hypothetical protein [Micromonospora sp.]
MILIRLVRCGDDFRPRERWPSEVSLKNLFKERIKRRPALGGLINEYEWAAWKAQLRIGNRVMEPHRSSGAAEGAVNRIKMIKREMYG